MLKMATNAMKHTTKLTASERNNVASIRLGKPKAEKPRCFVSRVLTGAFESFGLRGKMATEDMNGSRLTNRKSKLMAKTKTVASHGPMYGETVPTRASDSP